MASGEELLRFLNWRLDLLDRHQREVDAALSEEFSQRAGEVREQLVFLLENGLTEGAEASLAAVAEQDMGDFCIMVDLAQGVAIPQVDPLDRGIVEPLQEFLNHEPWHSLQVDNDVTVAIAMLEDVAARADEGPWYRVCPNMVRVVARVLDQVNKEQMQRFAGEIEAIHKRSGLQHPADVKALVQNLLQSNSIRLGIRPPELS